MDNSKLEQVWYASDRKAQTPFKLVVLDDRGRVTLSERCFEFWGRSTGVRMPMVDRVELSTQRLNWPAHVAAAIALFVYLRIREYSLGVALGLVGVTAILALTSAAKIKWVRVYYRTKNGDEMSAWFADGSKFGWGGIFGGTTKLFELLRAHLDALPQDIKETQPPKDNYTRG